MINSQSDITVFANPKRFLTTTPASRNILRIQPSMIPRMIQQSESDPWTTSGRASHHQTLVGLRPTNQTPQVLLNQGPAPCSHCIINYPGTDECIFSAVFFRLSQPEPSLWLQDWGHTCWLLFSSFPTFSIISAFPAAGSSLHVLWYCTNVPTVLIVLLLCTSLVYTQSYSLAATVLP